MTHSFCFATCSSGITNAAPGADNSQAITLGSFTCNEGEGGLNAASFASQWVTMSTNIQTSGAKTVAILLKHISGSENRVPREIRQTSSFILNSEPFPAARAEVFGGSGQCSETYSNVFSTTEFVLVVITVDGTSLTMYRNGVSLGARSCTAMPQANSNPLYLGSNHFGGTFKSFALWDRALSVAEVTGLDSSKLTC